MVTVNKWSNVQVAMESALGVAKTVTGINKGSTCTVTSTHDYSIGDYIKMSIQGMKQLDGRVVRVLSINTTVSWVAEGIDSTNFDTFSSGTTYKITFGTTLGTVTGVNGSGGDFNFIDTTTIHSNVKTQIPGIANPMNFSFENLWDMSDAALVAMKLASDTQAQKAFKFVFSTGNTMVFNGYVGASLIPGGSSQDKVTTKVDITAFGVPTYYAT